MKILVTGAGGTIGSYAIKALHSQKYSITGMYHSLPLNKSILEWNFIETDLLDSTSEQTLNNLSPDLIIHCAAAIPHDFDQDSLLNVAKKNEIIDDRIINFWKKNEDIALFYLSGTSLYGQQGGPWDEEDTLYPSGSYLEEKYKSEKKILSSNNPYKILRVSAPYAPEQRTMTVLRIFIEKALNNEDISYYGSGERTQDFTSATDIAQAILCGVQNKNVSGIFNIASGAPISMKNLAKLVLKGIPESKSQIKPAGIPDPQDKYRAIFNTHKAKDILKWTPQISLEEGILEWITFLKRKKELL